MNKRKSKPKTNYCVRWNGAVVGTISAMSVRYTHALVGQLHEETVRKWVFATPSQDAREDTHHSLFKHYAGFDSEWAKATLNQEDREFYKSRADHGFDVFVEQWRERRVKWFEEVCKSVSPFDVRVIRWFKPGEAEKSWREPLALSVFPMHSSDTMSCSENERLLENEFWYSDWTKVVPVETEVSIPVAQRFAKMPKKAQRELLGLVCDKMIEKGAWDEIAVLLTNYLEGDAPLILKLLGGQR
jgi:hypothetical protein